MDDGYVLVIGSAQIDIKGHPAEAIHWNATTSGRVRNSVGGVARNIAENLARLEVETVLLTAVGGDDQGKRILDQCEAHGVDCTQVRVVPDMRTCTHLSLLKPDGELAVGVTDFEILKHLDSDYLRQHEHLIADADMLVIDSTLSEDALATVFELADRYYVRVCADPTTPLLASRLRPYLNQLHLIVPNAGETAALCDLLTPVADREAALAAARHLATEGVYIAVVTMGAGGLAYAGEGGAGYIRAVHTHVVDPTGAGDALTGAVIFGLLNDVPLDEAMRLGVTAAALTLQTDETVAPELTQEVLYDRLMA